jgi:hypothetical protein
VQRWRGVEEEKYTSFFSDCILNGCGEHKDPLLSHEGSVLKWF